MSAKMGGLSQQICDHKSLHRSALEVVPAQESGKPWRVFASCLDIPFLQAHVCLIRRTCAITLKLLHNVEMTKQGGGGGFYINDNDGPCIIS